MGQQLSVEQRQKIRDGVDARVATAKVRALPEATERYAKLHVLPRASGFQEPASKKRKLSTGSVRSESRSSEEIHSPLLDPTESEELSPPQWYKDLARKNNRKGLNAAADTTIARLKDAIVDCKRPTRVSDATLRRLRDLLHKLPFQPVNGQLLRNHLILAPNSGLPQLFHERYIGAVNFPFDIKADAKELYTKWYYEIFETDLLRGILRGFSGGSVDSLDPAYKGTRQRANYHGNGMLVNGQWWPTQLACVRDGAHGESIAGIHGHAGEGAFSCVMSGSDYPDEDYGTRVLYCGTDSENGEVTEKTKRLLENEKLKRPVRFLRSDKLHSEYAPTAGLRYDGLYDVVSHELMANPSAKLLQRHRFTLIRQPGQDPIRGGDEPAARPTKEEKEWYEKDRKNRGYK